MDVDIYYMKEIDKELQLHLLVQSKCHRVPISNTIEELKNPSGILESEYREILDKLLKEK